MTSSNIQIAEKQQFIEINAKRNAVTVFMKNLFVKASSYKNLSMFLKDQMPIYFATWDEVEDNKETIQNYVRSEILVYFPDIKKINAKNLDNQLDHIMNGNKGNKDTEVTEKLINKLKSKLFNQLYQSAIPKMNHIDSCLGLIIAQCILNRGLFQKLHESMDERVKLFKELKKEYDINKVNKTIFLLLMYELLYYSNILWIVVYLGIFSSM